MGSAVSWGPACCILGSPPDRGACPSQIFSPSHPSVSSHDRGQTYSAEWSDDEGSNSFNASEANGGTNPFDEDSAGKGVRVRALYDYDGQEQDELSFKAGDGMSHVRFPCWVENPLNRVRIAPALWQRESLRLEEPSKSNLQPVTLRGEGTTLGGLGGMGHRRNHRTLFAFVPCKPHSA